MINLNGKTAIITGAGSGFGLGIAHHFVAAGAKVGVLDLNATAAQSVAADLGAHALALGADVTDPDSLGHAIEAFQQWERRIDIFVNNAGIGQSPTNLESVSRDTFDTILAVNMRSVYLTSTVIVPIMKRQQAGCILNIASTAGVSPRPGLTWYNASKGWVITATRSMAVELATHNIRVNAINPVAGETPMLSTFMGGDSDALRERFISTIPLGRLSTADDIAQAATYLCSDAASMVTGVALEVDGGRCI